MSKTMANWEKKLKIRHGEPIECLGLTFYPVKMARYEEFLEVKNAWTLRLTTLPAKYMVMPFLSALWALEYDSIMQTKKAVGFFERIIHFLYLTLRLEYNKEGLAKSVRCLREDPRQLSHSVLIQKGKEIEITPQEFAAYIRPLVAEQNGLEIPDESFNPELVQAEKDYAELHKAPLDYNTDSLIASVAYLSHLDESVIDDWTVLQFERRYKAIDRDKSFTLYRQAELSGMVKFPKGNPCPSWCYDKIAQSHALRSIAAVSKNAQAIGDLNAAISGAQRQPTTTSK